MQHCLGTCGQLVRQVLRALLIGRGTGTCTGRGGSCLARPRASSSQPLPGAHLTATDPCGACAGSNQPRPFCLCPPPIPCTSGAGPDPGIAPTCSASVTLPHGTCAGSDQPGPSCLWSGATSGDGGGAAAVPTTPSEHFPCADPARAAATGTNRSAHPWELPSSCSLCARASWACTNPSLPTPALLALSSGTLHLAHPYWPILAHAHAHTHPIRAAAHPNPQPHPSALLAPSSGTLHIAHPTPPILPHAHPILPAAHPHAQPHPSALLTRSSRSRPPSIP